ncbi:MAG TPA: ATP-binding protein [Acidimicrobiales bacterium]|nr:ATP-binding protein [Acidimicrobiales bacterium]
MGEDGRGPAGWTLRTRLVVLLATLAGLLAATLVVQLVLQARQRDVRNDLVNRIDPAVVALGDLRAATADQDSSVRGYALGGEPAFLSSYEEGRQAADEALARLDDLVGGVGDVGGTLDVVAGRVDDWQATFAEPAIAVTRAGTPVSEAVDTGGRSRFAAVRVAIDDVGLELDDRREAAIGDLDDAARRASLAMVVQTLGLVISGAVIMVALARVVVGPIERLGRDARVVAGGDLDHVVRGEGSPDLVRLGADVDAMRLRILAEVDQLNAASGDLFRQADELARSNADLEQFAYVASHDLQEPLRKVAGFCQLLQMRYADQLDERANEYIHYAVDGAKRMQDLINDLLTFSRVGRTSDAFQRVDLGAVVRDVVEVLGPAIEESNATVVVGDLPEVTGDRRLLGATVQNLISNALKFRTEEPPLVTIDATLRDGADAGLAGDGPAWVITVADNGIGIDPDYGEQIFTIFKRLHNRTEYAGTGIGLALAKKIVEYHGGRIWLEPTPPPGATFKIALPDTDSPERGTPDAD